MKKAKKLNLNVAISMLTNAGIAILLFIEMFAFDSFRSITGENSTVFKTVLFVAAFIMLGMFIIAFVLCLKLKNKINKTDEMTERIVYQSGWNAFRAVSIYCMVLMIAAMGTVLFMSVFNISIDLNKILDVRYFLLAICLAVAVGNVTFFLSAFLYDKRGEF